MAVNILSQEKEPSKLFFLVCALLFLSRLSVLFRVVSNNLFHVPM